ncbi:MAG: choice-of-anchor Q domain-containing protein [Bacteroidota bacterium]
MRVILLSLIFSFLALPLLSQPGNDDLCNADILIVDVPCTAFNGDNTGATIQSGEPIPGCFQPPNNSVWFTFKAPNSGVVEITTDLTLVGTNNDTEIALYSLPGGDCNNLGSLMELACHQDVDAWALNFMSTINVDTLTPNQDYYLQVSGYGGKVGTFCIQVMENAADSLSFVDQNATGANDGSSWQNAYTDLQTALANSAEGLTEIWVAAGTYHPTSGTDRAMSFLPKPGVKIYGGFDGTEATLADRATDSLSLHVLNKTVLSGNIGSPGNSGDNSYHVIRIDDLTGANSTTAVIVDGFTISDGYADGGTAMSISEFHDDGAGIRIRNVHAKIQHCVFVDHHADWIGSAIFINKSDVEVNDCHFSDNYANRSGGGLNIDEGDLKMSGCTFSDNSALTWGGAFRIKNSTGTISSCQFLDNQARTGGGVYSTRSSISFSDCLFARNLSGSGIFGDGGTINARLCTFIGQKDSFWGGAIRLIANEGLLDSCTFLNNKAVLGGGIACLGSVPVVKGCTFMGNDAFEGGGIYNNGSDPTVLNCLFDGNSGGDGAGIYNTAASSPLIEGSTFKNNQAFGRGGAIENFILSNPTITDCWFEKNQAGDFGGAIMNDEAAPTVTNCLFLDNQANDNGGGIYNQNADPTISFCSFINNKADDHGGGIANDQNSHLRIQNSAFVFNSAKKGGGMISENNSVFQLANCTFTQNSTSSTNGLGGALFITNIDDSIAFSLISASTIFQNTADAGGGLALDQANVILKNTVVAANTGNDVAHPGVAPLPASFLSRGHNLIGDTTGAQLSLLASDLWGTATDPLDPLLGPLDTYGGSTSVYPPLPGSPLIGAGEGGDSTGIRTDQRGFSRKLGRKNPQIDIGAFQTQSTFVTSAKRAVCIGDDDFLQVPDIALYDSTGGAFAPGQMLSLEFSLPDDLQFNPGVGSVSCQGTGLSDCSIVVTDSSFVITYSREYDTLVNSLHIQGLYLKSRTAGQGGMARIRRTGGNALQYANQVEDSVLFAEVDVVPTVALGDMAYDESFEENPGQWTPNSSESIWEWGVPEGQTILPAPGGGKAWMTRLNQSYPTNDTSWLASPCFDFTQSVNPILAMNLWSDTEEGFDGTVLQLSTDAGNSWQAVGDEESGINWYNSATIFANPGQQPTLKKYGWTGRDTTWKKGLIKLRKIQNNDAVRFRLAFGSISVVDTTDSNDGFAMDNFFIGEASKKVLLEHVSSSLQTTDNNRIQSLSEPFGDFIIPIQLHILPGDEFYEKNPAGPRARALYYGVSEPGIAIVDGNDFAGPTSELTSAILETSLLDESPITISIDSTEADAIRISSSRDLPGETIVYVAVIEHTADQPYVLRKFLPDAAGMNFFGWNQGQTETFDLEWVAEDLPSPSSIIDQYDSLQVVVFVQDRETREIYQTASSPIWTGLLDPAELREGSFPGPQSGNFRLYPNPVRGSLAIDFGRIQEESTEIAISDMQGKHIFSQVLPKGESVYKLDLAELAAGVYHLHLKGDTETRLARIVVLP